jgi:DNA-directed DNA polymerase III PolC
MVTYDYIMGMANAHVRQWGQMAFAPLLVRSGYTFYSGTMRAEEIPALAARLGYGAVGLCDRDGLYAAVRFYKAARAQGVNPVIGAELTSASATAPSRAGGMRGVARRSSPSLFVFARDFNGYSRLCSLVTRRRLEPRAFKRVEESALATKGGHVAIVASDVALLYELKQAGAEGGSLFAALAGTRPTEEAKTRAAAEWLGLPLVAFPPVFFADPSGYAVHRVLRAVKRLEPEAGARDYLLGPNEAAERFAKDRRALDGAGALAASCSVTLPLGDWLLPSPPLKRGETHEGRLRSLAYAGLAKRVRNVTAPYLRRLESELSVIARMGFSGYFLVVEEIAGFARLQGIPNIGRGSGASSLVSYCLFLTHVDPVAEGLYFERFLNPERKNPPDIDLDFSWRERETVIRHVYDAYGEENVCMIGTHNSFSMRSGFREAGKALSIPEEEVGAIARAVPHATWGKYEAAVRARPESRKAHLERDAVWRGLLKVASWVDGLPRHLSVHCGGVVVSPVPLTERLSLERSARGVAITQADMFDVEDMGLIKIDLLGNRSLGVMVDAVAAVKDHAGEPPPIFPPERVYRDLKTNLIISQGRTMGCFYIESPGMRLLLQRLQTRTFRDLTAVSSIIRPGVSESGMMETYVRRALKEEPPSYLHPALEPILGETFGVMVYQEDVIRVAHEFIGLSLGEADLLRRAMSGKYRSRSEMDSLAGAFFAKGSLKGLPSGLLASLWEQIKSFAGYAFCKAHSASFAQLSYQVAYLKAHHPAEFFAALINNQGGFYGTAAYVEEARRWNIELLPVDANLSQDDFAGHAGRIRCGFFTLRGVRRATIERLYEERGEGPFRSLGEMMARLEGRLAPQEAEVLVRAGACDGLGPHRGYMLWLLRQYGGDPKALRRAEKDGAFQSEYATPQSNAAEAAEIYDPSPPKRPAPGLEQAQRWSAKARVSLSPGRPLSLAELLAGERRALGYCVTAHPLTPLIAWAGERGYANASGLRARAGQTARAWGQVITYKRITTRKKGDGMAFATLEDPTGLCELVFFPKAYAEYGELLTSGRPLVVEGKVEEERGGLTLTVSRAWAIRGIAIPRPIEAPSAYFGTA